ncbi:hypothetical protein [Pseudanabaena sp. 'Roaring Creek']|uniref:hypothetical protein n=1 Tax=Pseudanabaena sp. 'Roaring Creek' TaxID=1681830 RepID=UPI0012E14E73|nr:hypothetical protein [Pseudanabaena sp. 'Roaring Creek']
MNEQEASYLVPLKEAQDIAAIALRDVKPELINPEICEWAISEAMRGVSVLAIRTQALEAQAIALSQRVDKVEDKLERQQEEISILKAGQYAQDKIMGFLQNQTQHAQTMAMEANKESGKKHLWIHDPTGMMLACGIFLALFVLVVSFFTRVNVYQAVPPQTPQTQGAIK